MALVSMLKLQELTPSLRARTRGGWHGKVYYGVYGLQKTGQHVYDALRSNFRRQCEARLLQHARNAIECIRMQSIFGWIWKWMSGSSTGWHDEMNHTYSKQPDWAGYQKNPRIKNKSLKKLINNNGSTKKRLIKVNYSWSRCIQQPRVGTNPTLRSVLCCKGQTIACDKSQSIAY